MGFLLALFLGHRRSLPPDAGSQNANYCNCMATHLPPLSGLALPRFLPTALRPFGKLRAGCRLHSNAASRLSWPSTGVETPGHFRSFLGGRIRSHHCESASSDSLPAERSQVEASRVEPSRRGRHGGRESSLSTRDQIRGASNNCRGFGTRLGAEDRAPLLWFPQPLRDCYQ